MKQSGKYPFPQVYKTFMNSIFLKGHKCKNGMRGKKMRISLCVVKRCEFRAIGRSRRRNDKFC